MVLCEVGEQSNIGTVVFTEMFHTNSRDLQPKPVAPLYTISPSPSMLGINCPHAWKEEQLS